MNTRSREFEDDAARIRSQQVLCSSVVVGDSAFYLCSPRGQFDLELHTRRQLGRQIGDFIADRTDLLSIEQRYVPRLYGREFVAQCIVLSTAQFDKMIRDLRSAATTAREVAGAAEYKRGFEDGVMHERRRIQERIVGMK